MYKFDTEGVKFEITRESDGTFVISVTISRKHSR